MKKLMTISVRLPDELLTVIDAEAGKKKRSAFVRQAVETHVAMLGLLRALGLGGASL